MRFSAVCVHSCFQLLKYHIEKEGAVCTVALPSSDSLSNCVLNFRGTSTLSSAGDPVVSSDSALLLFVYLSGKREEATLSLIHI